MFNLKIKTFFIDVYLFMKKPKVIVTDVHVLTKQRDLWILEILRISIVKSILIFSLANSGTAHKW